MVTSNEGTLVDATHALERDAPQPQTDAVPQSDWESQAGLAPGPRVPGRIRRDESQI